MVTISLTDEQLFSLVSRTGGETYGQLNPHTRAVAGLAYSRAAYDGAWRALTAAANKTADEEGT